jgi:hypothetical protein
MNVDETGEAHVLAPEPESDTATEVESPPVARPWLKVVSPSVIRPSLASLLAEERVVSDEQLGSAIAEGMGSDQRLGEFVLRRGWIDEAELGRLVARQWELPFMADGEVAAPEQAVAALLSPSEASALEACATALSKDGSVQVAVGEPSEERFAAVRAALQRECRFVVVTRQTLERLLGGVSDSTEAHEGADAPVGSAEEVAEMEAAEVEADEALLLLADLDDATSHLAAFRGRLEQLAQRQQQADRELAGYREQLLTLTDERDRERETVDRLERELARHQELLSVVRDKLTDATGALGMDVQG